MAVDLGEVCDLLEREHERRNPGVRLYRSKVNNDRDRYRALVDWAYSDHRRGRPLAGWHRITHGQLAAQVYGVEPTADEGKKKSESNRRSLVRLADAGLIEWRPALNPTGTGRQTVALEFRLLPLSAPAGIAQSVRAAES